MLLRMRYWVQPICFASDVSIIITDYTCNLNGRTSMFNDKVHLMPTGQWLLTVTLVCPTRKNASKPTVYSCGC